MNEFFLKTAISLINTLLERVVDAGTLGRIKQLVAEAAAFAGMSGAERRDYVLEQIAAHHQYITSYVPSWLVNLAIEVIVAKSKVSK